ncbi:ABC transporter ATP-binding protein [Vibrio ulleungensis]|uniref:ATP-binding cassette domain-containing protein n=1 Tax=Vibrio ulleungensis TaxID=2807619 RepID=A0ABS2HHB4_9VIBR|nr:oligopeptide/dipeptide ABC transporter ATP-binding protein [Vibrio ulleungensis]MBM7035217.1 ATP-binding cassette domain-containing protein [Vibrio ulleungensis]
MNQILRVNNLEKTYTKTTGFFSRTVSEVKAVNNVNFDVRHGETLGIVGESGCGKSTTGRCIIGIESLTNGNIKFVDHDYEYELDSDTNSCDRQYWTKIRYVFQDPNASLNPRLTVFESLAQPLTKLGVTDKEELKSKVGHMLVEVGLREEHMNRYPNEFSGGQRQRISIARALIVNPSFVIADEAVSALDVSVQAQILNLLKDLQEKYQLTYIFISHDLSVVRHICNRVAVMYMGEIVELGDVEQVYGNPQHPYTRALLSAMPIQNPKDRNKINRINLRGEVGDARNLPTGCKFAPRCPNARSECSDYQYRLVTVGKEHTCACIDSDESEQ